MEKLNADRAEARAHLRAKLYQWCELDTKMWVHLMLDPNHPVSAEHPLHSAALANRPVKLLQARAARPDLASTPELHPLLVQLRSPKDNGYPDEALLDLALDCAVDRASSVNGAYVASWICCNQSVAETARHLSKSGVVFDLGRGKRRFIPVFEPHRFALLADDGAAHPYLRVWLGRLAHWLIVDVNGQVRSYSADAVGGDAENGGSEVRPALSAHHFAMLDRVDAARFVLVALASSKITLMSAPERKIDQSLARACAAGLRHTEDLVFYALNDFTLEAGWSMHPVSAGLIHGAAANTGSRFSSAMSALDDSMLEEIARHRPAER